MHGDTLENNIAVYALYDGWGKVRYIGRTSWLRKRFIQHCRQKAWAVGVKVLEWVNAATWRKSEGDWILYYRKEGADLENKNNGGGGSLFLTEEHKRKIGITLKGLELKYPNRVSPIKGKKMSPEQVEQNRQAQLNRNYVASEETRRKISEACKGRAPWSKGLTLSIETKEKIRASCKAVVKTPEWNRKNSESLKRWYAENPEAAKARAQKISEGHKKNKGGAA